MDLYQSLFAGLTSANNSIRKQAENELEKRITVNGIFLVYSDLGFTNGMLEYISQNDVNIEIKQYGAVVLYKWCNLFCY